MWETIRVRDIDELQHDIGDSLATPEVILSTSKVSVIFSITDSAKPVMDVKNNRYVNNQYQELTLYDLSYSNE